MAAAAAAASSSSSLPVAIAACQPSYYKVRVNGVKWEQSSAVKLSVKYAHSKAQSERQMVMGSSKNNDGGGGGDAVDGSSGRQAAAAVN